MADEEQLAILRRGVNAWNAWKHSVFGRDDYSEEDISEIDLTRAGLRGADLRGADLGWADLYEADLIGARLSGANLMGANLGRAYLYQADLRGADLRWSALSRAALTEADLTEANLGDANLSEAILVGADLSGADLSGCRIYGVSAWDVTLDGTKQDGLVITPDGEPTITVDNLKVAQFVYLLLDNDELRGVIDTVGRKAVLLLGRFTPGRKRVLDAIRDELRRHDYLPIMFDFAKPGTRGFTETVSTLAHMARFVIADVTGALVVLQELERIVPRLPSVPVQPILKAGTEKNLIVGDFEDYPWFLETFRYRDLRDVRASLPARIIGPAEAKANEIEQRHARRGRSAAAARRQA